MSETAITVAEAARDFLGLLQRIETRQETAILVRDGQPVAMLSPCTRPAATCEELASRWSQLARLTPDEAEAFARDLEGARTSLPPLKAAWD